MLINTTNLGMVGNWNRCLRVARAPIVTLLHADDELAPLHALLDFWRAMRWLLPGWPADSAKSSEVSAAQPSLS